MLSCILLQVYEGSVSFFQDDIDAYTGKSEKAKRENHYDFFRSAKFFNFAAPHQ
jgi:hypothetical protein